MTALTLTDEFIKAVKPVSGRQIEYPDAKVSGLALRVSHRGTKSWTLRFRTAEGRQRRLSLGTYPATPLAKARRRAMEALGEAQDGRDPAKEKREEKAKAGLWTVRTVADLAADYFAAARKGRHRKEARPKRQTTLALEEGYFERHLRPKFGKVAVGELLRPVFQRFLDDLGENAPTAARQCRNIMRQMYNYAIRREITDRNPAQFGDVPVSGSRERILTDIELKAIWLACEHPENVNKLKLSRSMGLALQLAMITLQRGNEICAAALSEFDFEARTWIIPGERTKNHRSHVVPLSNLAIGIVREALALPNLEGEVPTVRKNDRYIFSARRNGQPFTRRAFTRAMKRLTTALKIENATPHDFRRTGSTHMTSERLGILRFHVSCVLNHISDTGGAAAVTAVYDRNAYIPEKRRALDKWAIRLLEIVGQRQ